ncbi:MAG: ParB/RepB/Spo0J family partition protein [Chloroflexota bacterium]|nr:ParB/RepB/Spo0J family partition protein [Chloroflexota bacterium]
MGENGNELEGEIALKEMVTKLTTRLEPLGAEALRNGLTPFLTLAQTVEAEAVPLEMIRFGRHTFRLTQPDSGLKELADTIKRHGFVGTLVGRRKGSMIEVAFGERRVRAAELAGLKTVPVQVRELNDKAMFELALEENFLSSKLSPLEEALLFQIMLTEEGYTLDLAALRCARTPQYLAERLWLVKYPEIEEALRTGQIEVDTATTLAKVDNKVMRTKMLRQAQALGSSESGPTRFIVTSIGLELPTRVKEETASLKAKPAPDLWVSKGKTTKGSPKTSSTPAEEQYASLEALVKGFVEELKKQELSNLAHDDTWRKKARKLLRSLEDELDNSYKQFKS